MLATSLKLKQQKFVKVTIHRHELAYTDLGSGTAVIFLHAFPLNRLMWSPQVSAFQERFRIITLDLRGHGESSASLEPYTIEDFSVDVKGFLDHLSIQQAVLVGLSMGGYVSLAFYRRFAERVKALVLADTRAQADNAETRAARLAMIKTAESEGSGAVADLMLPKLLSPASLKTKPDLVGTIRAIIEQTPVGTIQGDLRAMAERMDATSLLNTIICPTLVLVGEIDQATPPSEARQMAGRIPGACLHIIPQAAHLSNLEQPAAFNGAILSFLETLP